jgi:hypothetical protein
MTEMFPLETAIDRKRNYLFILPLINSPSLLALLYLATKASLPMTIFPLDGLVPAFIFSFIFHIIAKNYVWNALLKEIAIRRTGEYHIAQHLYAIEEIKTYEIKSFFKKSIFINASISFIYAFIYLKYQMG